MGIGTPDYILEAIENGIDMFDCVLPTRNARNGSYFTRDGAISIKNARYASDFGPIDSECNCKICRQYSRAYLRHLFKEQEILSSMLASYHNLAFLHQMIIIPFHLLTSFSYFSWYIGNKSTYFIALGAFYVFNFLNKLLRPCFFRIKKQGCLFQGSFRIF